MADGWADVFSNMRVVSTRRAGPVSMWRHANAKMTTLRGGLRS